MTELLKQIDSNYSLDEEACSMLTAVADEFVDSVTSFSCKLARHRKSNTLEAKDIQMHLERSWDIFFTDENETEKNKKRPSELHIKRISEVKKARNH